MSKKKQVRKRSDEADEIRKAERKLAEALADVEAARAVVAKRERKLSALMTKHGITGEAESIPANTGIDQVSPIEAVPMDEDGTSEEDVTQDALQSEPA